MANKERNKRSARKARSEQRSKSDVIQGEVLTSSDEVAGKAQTKASKPVKKVKKDGILAHIKGYFSDVRTEMRRVVWPSREELKNYSLGAIAMLVICGFVVWIVDTGILLVLAALSGLRG